jgi:hypothetical protein
MTDPIVATGTRYPKIVEELACRLMIGTFIFLCWKLTQAILKPVEDGVVQLVLLILSEIPVMVVMALLFGKRNVTQDVIEFNFYALLVHAIGIPIYLVGIESTYHNNAIIVLWCLTLGRLLYVGPRTPHGDDFKGLPTFGVIGHVRQWLEETPPSKGKLFYRYSAHFLFFGSALPLWLIMIRSNDSFITSTIVTLMIFVFLIANHWHRRNTFMQNEAERLRIDLLALRQEVENLKQKQSINQQETMQDSVRDVAGQLLAAYKSTHPNIQNMNVTIAKYVERNFPDESIFHPASISVRRARAATQLVELVAIAKDQLQRNECLGNLQADVARLTAKFNASLKFELDEVGMVAFMDYVMGLPPLEVPDTTFLLACDVLTTAWMRCLFSSDTQALKAEYSVIELLTREFLARFIPTELSLESHAD